MRMKCVTVLYFAAIREMVGVPSEQLELPDEVGTVGEFLCHLGRQRTRLAGIRGVRVARNEVFAALDEALESGDQLALIPPVQGG